MRCGACGSKNYKRVSRRGDWIPYKAWYVQLDSDLKLLSCMESDCDNHMLCGGDLDPLDNALEASNAKLTPTEYVEFVIKQGL